MIISILQFQSDFITDIYCIPLIKKMQSRIYAIASVHEAIRYEQSLESIELELQIERIIDFISIINDVIKKQWHIEKDIESITIPVVVAVPLSLILHEVILNSILHAKNERDFIKINLKAYKNDLDFCCINIIDNGECLLSDADDKPNKGIGKILIEGLSEQIKGSIVETFNEGYSFSIRFPLDGAGTLQCVSN